MGTEQDDELEHLTYVIRTDHATESVDGRTAAVAQAKQISSRTRRPIGVESEDGRVKMQFQRGALLSYRLETLERR